MRYVSKYAKYMINVRKPIIEYYATGQQSTIQSEITAVFDVGLVSGDERALARSHFSFNGFSQEQDEVTIVEPDARISAYDTRLAQIENGWSDEERELVERALNEEAQRLPDDMIAIEETRTLPPWPNYDSFKGSRDQLLSKIEEDGFDFAQALAYERENQNRPEIVAALEQSVLLKQEGLMVREQLVQEEELLG